MGRFDTIKTTIDANIKENGSQEITGQKMNSVLTEMVNATDAELTELESKMDGMTLEYKVRDYMQVPSIALGASAKITLISSGNNAQITFYGKTQLSDSDSQSLGKCNVGQTLEFIADREINYIKVYNQEPVTPIVITIIPENSIAGQISSLDKKITSAVQKKDIIKLVPNGYLKADGTINNTSLTGYYVTPYMRVNEGITFKSRYVGSAKGCAVCFFDGFFTLVEGTIYIESSQQITLTNENIPTNAVYFRANVVEGTTFEDGVIFYPFDVLGDVIKDFADKNQTLYGKKYCSIGSSTSIASWHQNAVGELGMEFLKFGIGGAHFYCDDNATLNYEEVESASPDNVIMNQVARLYKYADDNNYYPDVITILSGLNDCYNTNLVATTFEQALAADLSGLTPINWFDAPSSIKGNTLINLRAVLKFLSEKFPLSQVIVITYQKVASPSFQKAAIEHFYKNELQIAQHFAFPVIDFYTKCGWNTEGGTISIFSSDNLHPNATGGIVLKNFLVRHLTNEICLRR